MIMENRELQSVSKLDENLVFCHLMNHLFLPFGLVFFEHTAYIRSAVKYLAKKKNMFAGGLSDTALRIRSYFSKA